VGAISTPEPALLVASVLGRTAALVNAAADALSRQVGRLGHVSPLMPFRWTDYYGHELGDAPVRRMVAADALLEDPSRLVGIKRACCGLEVSLGRAGDPRPVNIDPGVLTAGQLVLASTKASPHRIYLGDGIHGELTLIRDGDGYRPLPWTYPDYADQQLRAYLDALRRRYLAARRMAA